MAAGRTRPGLAGSRLARLVIAAEVAVFAGLAMPGVAGAAAGGPDVAIVVGLRPGTASGARAAAVAASVAGAAPAALPGQRELVRVPAADATEAISSLRANPSVSYATVPKVVHEAALPADPDDSCYQAACGSSSDSSVVAPVEYLDGTDQRPPARVAATQGDLATINAPGAWSVTHGSAGVSVAVIDGPVDAGHPDLAGKVTVVKNDCTSSSSCSTPAADSSGADVSLGHGTHVVGTIAAATDNATGIAGIGWNTDVDTFQALDATGAGTTADVASAIFDAVAHGDRVINMSLTGPTCADDPVNCGPDPDTEAAVAYAEQQGDVVVAAAGNAAESGGTYPAAYPGVLAVAASDDSGAIAGFSEFGTGANIAAPGVDTLSTWDDGQYAVLSGTSMAAPHVAAAAALVLSAGLAAGTSYTGRQVFDLLRDTVGPTSGPGIDGGELNAGSAVHQAATGVAPAPSGYEMAGADGSTYGFGGAIDLGGVSHLAQPVVGAAVTGTGLGGWLVAGDGGVFALGKASFFGSTGNLRLAKPVVGMAATPDGGGYWLVASDGGIFAFGDARFFGSTGNLRLAKPVVGMAATPDGGGYWLVASDGGIFAFGDARFLGSAGALTLREPVTGMTATADGQGYWMVASDGGIFAYGDAPFGGSLGGQAIPGSIVGISRA